MPEVWIDEYAGGGCVRAEHFHDHPANELVIGCLACIDVVKYDQYKASWTEAPTRTCTWRFKSTYEGDWLSFTLDVRVAAGATPDEVDERYMEATGPEVAIAMEAAGDTPDEIADSFYCACLTIECDRTPLTLTTNPTPHASFSWRGS